MTTYIDHISPSLRNFQDSMGGLQQMKHNSIQRNMEAFKLLNYLGRDEDAEKYLHAAENYGISGLFAGSPKGTRSDNPFAGEERELLEVPKLNAQQEILAELQGLYGDDTDSYNQNIQALAADITNRQIQEQGIGNSAGNKGVQPMWNDTAALLVQNLQGIRDNEQAVQRQAQIQSQNEAIQRENEKVRAEKYFVGNEGDRINALTERAYREIENAKTYEDKLRIYGKYKNAYDNIRGEFQKTGKLPAFNEIIPPPDTGGGKRQKFEKINITDRDGNTIGAVMVPQDVLTRGNTRARIMRLFPDLFKDAGITNTADFEVRFATGENSDIETRKLNASSKRTEQALIDQHLLEERARKIVSAKEVFQEWWQNKSLGKAAAIRAAYNKKMDEAGDNQSSRFHPVSGQRISYNEYSNFVNNNTTNVNDNTTNMTVDGFLK